MKKFIYIFCIIIFLGEVSYAKKSVKKAGRKSSNCKFEEIKKDARLSRDGKFVFPSKKSISIVASQKDKSFDVVLLSDLGQKRCSFEAGEIKKVYIAEKAKKVVIWEQSGFARELQTETCEQLDSATISGDLQFKDCRILSQ